MVYVKTVTVNEDLKLKEVLYYYETHRKKNERSIFRQ